MMVKNNDIRKEIEQLRNQLDALKQTQNQPNTDIQQPDTEANAVKLETEINSALNALINDIEGSVHLDLADQLKDLIDVLDKEMKASNPMTMLVVFSLGILVGRLLSK